jgi:hypothetical protein
MFMDREYLQKPLKVNAFNNSDLAPGLAQEDLHLPAE